MKTAITLMEKGWLPDTFIRMGMKRINNNFLTSERRLPADTRQQKKAVLLKALKDSPLAIHTDKANEQHYEIPAQFYDHVLGKWKKYSSCLWDHTTKTLDEAEELMLATVCQRAEIQDGMTVLDLGCGWGSMTLWLATHYPNCNIVSVSNSHSQRAYIETQCELHGFNNVTVHTCDVNKFDPGMTFDRIVSIEMFEHVRNYKQLFDQIQHWLKPEGKLFVHIFCHDEIPYTFETEGDLNWMGQYFFTGGTMPSSDLLLHFQNELKIKNQWKVDGTHYQKTARAWLNNQDQHKTAIINLFQSTYGEDQASLWFQRWRVFFMACEELFGFKDGSEWYVIHYLFQKPG